MAAASQWGLGISPANPGRSIGGKVDEVSEQTKVVPFPLRTRTRAPAIMTASAIAAAEASQTGARKLAGNYEFSERELASLCRWFSAMKYAFPGTEGVMIVSHQESYSAVGLYNRVGHAPNCLVAKHEVGGVTRIFWSTEFDSPRLIADVAEITDAHIRAIHPPRDEKGWLDPAGWMGVYASRLIATELQVV